MANIEINNINLSGIELFTDSESFFDRINDVESSSIYGGQFALCPTDKVPVDEQTIPLIMTGPPQSLDCLPQK